MVYLHLDYKTTVSFIIKHDKSYLQHITFSGMSFMAVGIYLELQASRYSQKNISTIHHCMCCIISLSCPILSKRWQSYNRNYLDILFPYEFPNILSISMLSHEPQTLQKTTRIHITRQYRHHHFSGSLPRSSDRHHPESLLRSTYLHCMHTGISTVGDIRQQTSQHLFRHRRTRNLTIKTTTCTHYFHIYMFCSRKYRRPKILPRQLLAFYSIRSIQHLPFLYLLHRFYTNTQADSTWKRGGRKRR